MAEGPETRASSNAGPTGTKRRSDRVPAPAIIPATTCLAVAVVSIGSGILLARTLRFGLVDDAYISLRYAANWAAGRGWVFNPGEVVEGFTNFLLVLLQGWAISLGLEPLRATSLLAWGSYGLLAGILFLAIRSRVLQGGGISAAVLAVIGSLQLPILAWAASGMETCLYAALILAAALSCAATGKTAPWFCGVLAGLAALTRPEGVVLFPVFAVAIARRDGLRGLGAFFVALALGFGPATLYRFLTFGHLLPNTFYAKLDYGSAALASRGAAYLGSFARTQPLLLLAGIASLFPLGRAPAWLRLCAACAAAHSAAVVYMGGDHFALFRFLAPTLPLWWLMALHALERMRTRVAVKGPLLVALAAVFTGTGSLQAGLAGIEIDGQRRRQIDQHVLESTAARQWSAIGEWLRRAAPEEATVATIAIGAIGFHSGLTIVDPHGIVDPSIARMKMPLGSGHPGHEKYSVEHLLARQPDYILVLNWITETPIPEEELPAIVWGDFNRGLLASESFRSAYRYTSVRIGPRAFVNIHYRTDREPIQSPARDGRGP